MANPITGFHFIRSGEVALAQKACAADQARVAVKYQQAEVVGEYAKSVAPILLVNALAIAVLSYLRVFTLLSFLNCRVTTYAVPAAASYAANGLAEKVEPAMRAVGSVAGVAAKYATLATMNQYDRYIAAQ